ncbi:MAG: L-threonylcarbamoyladenylate synthase [Candidatus Saccharimonadales bacterium]
MKILDFSVTGSELVDLLRAGSVGVMLTDTVYGLVCRADDRAAVTRLYALKLRHHKPGTIIAAKIQQLIDLGVKARYLKAVEGFWPNPLSVVIPCGEDLSYLHMGVGSLALRIPKNDELRQFLSRTGPLLTSSANLPGQPIATNLDEARNYFGEQVDFYVDSGSVTDHSPSTVIRVVDDAIEVLRLGAVIIDENGRIES